MARRGTDNSGPSLRELIVRGRYGEAANALVELRQQLQKAQNAVGNGQSAAEAAMAWCEQAQSAVAAVLRTERQARSDPRPETIAQLEQAHARALELEKSVKPPPYSSTGLPACRSRRRPLSCWP